MRRCRSGLLLRCLCVVMLRGGMFCCVGMLRCEAALSLRCRKILIIFSNVRGLMPCCVVVVVPNAALSLRWDAALLLRCGIGCCGGCCVVMLRWCCVALRIIYFPNVKD